MSRRRLRLPGAGLDQGKRLGTAAVVAQHSDGSGLAFLVAQVSSHTLQLADDPLADLWWLTCLDNAVRGAVAQPDGDELPPGVHRLDESFFCTRGGEMRSVNLMSSPGPTSSHQAARRGRRPVAHEGEVRGD